MDQRGIVMVKRVLMETATNIRRGRDRARLQESVRDRVKENQGIQFQDQDLPRLRFLTLKFKKSSNRYSRH